MLHAMRSFLWKVKGLKNIMVRSTEFVKATWGHAGLKAGLTHVLANCPTDANFNIGDWSTMTGPSGDGSYRVDAWLMRCWYCQDTQDAAARRDRVEASRQKGDAL
jgi:hypothetical protein